MYKKTYPWLLVFLLWGVGLLNYLDRQMLSTMRPAMQVDIQELQSATNFGYLMSIFLWIYGLMSPFAGLIADKVNRKWLIVLSLFVWSGVTFAMGYATTYHQLYILRAIMGISEALYLPAGLALIADFHKIETRSLAIGIHMTGLYLGSALGGFGALVASAYTWHVTFHAFGLIGMVYSIVLIIFLKENKDHIPVISSFYNPTSFFQSFVVLFKNISFWIILLYFAVPSLPGWATKNWLPTLFSQQLHMPMSSAGPLSTFTLSVSSFIGVIIGGFLSDKWIQRNLKGRIYTGAMGLGLTIPGLFFLGMGHSNFTLIAAGVCFGIGFGMFDANNMPILCQFVSTRYRATAYGIMNMTGIFLGAFITSILGKATDAGHLGRNFAVLASVVMFVLIIQISFLKPKVNDFDDLLSVKN
jgi:ACS family D-galactonate transporter-like MFS transporter